MDRGKNLGNTSLGKIIKERVERRPLEEKVRWSSQNWKEESMGDIKKPISFFFFLAGGCCRVFECCSSTQNNDYRPV